MPPGSDTTAESAAGGQSADRPHGPEESPRTRGPQSGSGTAGRDGATATAAQQPPVPADARPVSGDAAAAAARRGGRLSRFGTLVRREAARTAAAALAGLALALAFPPYGLWPLSLLTVAALSLLTRGRTVRQGAWTGFAFGWPFFVMLLKWLHVVGWDAVLGLAFIESLFVAALGAALAATSRLPLWPLWGACLWVAEEWARDRVPFGGFPWGRLAFANTGSPYTPLAALGGAPLVTYAAALTGTALAAAALALWHLRGVRAAGRTQQQEHGKPEPGATSAPARTGSRRPLAPLLSSLALATLVTAAGYAVPVPTAADDTADIAVVQGNVEQPGMNFLGRPMKILNNHVDTTLDLARRIKAGKAEQPDLVIWPENSSDLDPYRWPEARERIDEAAKAVGVPILVGALVDHPGTRGYVENQGIVWDPEKGPGASYTKQHPVPFGEYVPFRDELSKVITRLQQIPRDFWPGDRTGVLQTGPARLGDVICFEVAYDEIPRATVKDGARALVVQTNNATYGRTGQPEQQLVMSKLRAVEHGRAVVTAATSGISSVVGPDGTIKQRTQEFERDVLSARLPLRDEITLADRVGAVPEWVIAMVGVLACAAAWYTGRRSRTGLRWTRRTGKVQQTDAQRKQEGQQR
ncbi:apolipoprotein N-acyltransferase [Streptomyces sp. WMMB 322]|uniref:apolipoprotein N-acyltransferase n=1 Tax=Streptomyces sp. WMMB 322 TaxID=1286821 RepID=UPI0006E204E5|nr:apolipoprotein N-acyltransferase [Streptomyces sp. WMMB 322]SCK56901.1 apolipoprotein N-acyltransferase [Streptomyces sp. WMMB 322]